jgi:hypothetical protein
MVILCLTACRRSPSMAVENDAHLLHIAAVPMWSNALAGSDYSGMPVRSGRVTDEELRAAVDRARRLTECEPEPFRSAAFQTLLDYLINNRSAIAEPKTPEIRPGLDLNEFLATLGAETHPDRVLAIAFYQERYSGGPPVTTRELGECYQRARIKRPQNFPDVIASLVRKGYLAEGPRREGLKSWALTGSGSARVERGL